MSDPIVDPEATQPQAPSRPSKAVTPQPPVVEAIPWWQSTQMKLALTVVAGSIVGVLHALCKIFGWCVLQNVEVSDVAVLLSGVATLVGGIYWVVKRIAVGKDPTNTSAPLTLK